LTTTTNTTTGRWVLFAAILASSMAFIDGSALNIALPSIQEALAATGSDLLWIVNAYALFLAALILVGGSLGDRYGRKRIFMIGIALFAAASLACGLAPNTNVLIAARAIQGVGGALMIPGSLALIAASFEPSQRGRAIGTWSAFSTLTTILGPVLGGELAGRGLWRFIFFINIPLALAALAVLYAKVPESRDESAPAELDYLGALLVTFGLAGITYGFIEAPRLGWRDPLILIALFGGIIALVAFVLVEMRSPHPLIPLAIFQSRTFTGTNAMTLFLYAALAGALFFLPLNLVQIQGYPAALAGRAILPFALSLVILSRWAGGLVDRYGPRLLLTIGPLITGVGFLLLSRPGLTGGPADYWTTFLPPILTLGVGMGITVAPLTTAVMGSAPAHYAGSASGINNAVARTAGVLAVAIMGAIALLTFQNNLAARTSTLELPAEAHTALQAEAEKLGEAQPPTSLPPATQTAVEQAIKQSFNTMFRLMNYIAAALAWISALLAALLVEKRITSPDTLSSSLPN
jgi:EmrB/QacA subfamily drug resistance transporter